MQDAVSFIELGSADAERSAAFFQRVFAWDFNPMGGGEAEPPQAETPGFGRFSSCRDPQGIRFGLHQPVE